MTPIIETERLILREIDIEADLDMWHDMMSDEETVRYIGGQTMCRAGSWRQMATMIGHQAVRGYGFWSVVEKSSGDWVGRVGPWNPVGWPEPEVGWTIHKNYRGKGYAKESAKACVEYCFNTLGWNRIIHVIDLDNVGSIKVAEAIGSREMYKIDKLPPFEVDNCWAWGQERA